MVAMVTENRSCEVIDPDSWHQTTATCLSQQRENVVFEGGIVNHGVMSCTNQNA